MALSILSVATALPHTRVTQKESVQIAQNLARTDEAEVLASLYEGTTIATRHFALERDVVQDMLQGTRHSESVFLPSGEDNDPGPTTAQRMQHYVDHAGPLAVRAARQALVKSKLHPSAITHLVTVSCTGFSAPGVDVELIKHLELPATVERTHVGFMGCHGALNGLRVARAFADADPGACILVCAVELCGSHYHYPWDPKKMVANALFADGAAALVGVAVHAGPGSWQVTASGSCIFANSENAMTWNIGDHGFEMTLATKVPELIARNLRPWFDRWLARNGLSVADVASWAVHPGGPRILTAVEQALGLDAQATAVSREVLAECGNMSSATILFLIDGLRKRSAPLPCVALGFGPGLTAEAALFQ
ncbi:MAG TPA: type III polyketide synthase [Gemmataceae bacterium]|jgi:predicted naringenin-chalcone synthase|nr:type III polyketide synthase [Gemmataceae bacterium]